MEELKKVTLKDHTNPPSMILNRKFQQVFFLIYLTPQKNQATIYHHTTSFSYFDLHLPTSSKACTTSVLINCEITPNFQRGKKPFELNSTGQNNDEITEERAACMDRGCTCIWCIFGWITGQMSLIPVSSFGTRFWLLFKIIQNSIILFEVNNLTWKILNTVDCFDWVLLCETLYSLNW